MSYCTRCGERDRDVAELAAENERLRAVLVDIYKLAFEHREFAISGRCRTALGPGVPGVSAPDDEGNAG